MIRYSGQDSEDRIKRKRCLQSLAEKSGKDVFVRIVCHEFEAWHFDNLKAVDRAYDRPDITKRHANKKQYCRPDEVLDVKKWFKSIFTEQQ